MTTAHRTLKDCIRGPFEGITHIWLNGDKIGNNGVKELCQVLHKYKDLKELGLGGNIINYEGVLEICRVLPKCEALSDLSLENNPISCEGVQCILEVLPCLPKSMKAIYLVNSLGKTETNIIDDALQTCTSWQYKQEEGGSPIIRQSEHCEHCKQTQEAKKKAKEEAEKESKEGADKTQEAKKKAKEEAEKKAKEEAEKKAKEEAEKKAKEEAEKKAKEEAEKKAKEEAEKKANEEAEKKANEEAEKKAKEEAAKKANEEAGKKAKEAKEEYINVGAILSLEGFVDWLKYDVLRAAMDILEAVELKEGLTLRNEMTKIEESIQQSQSEVEPHHKEMASEEFLLKWPGLVERLEYEYKTLVLEVSVLQQHHRQKSVASQAVRWQCNNEETMRNVRIVVEAILAGPRQRQEQSEVLNTLRRQHTSRGAALEKCRECIESIKEASEIDNKKECQSIISSLEEFTGVLSNSVTSLEGRIQEIEGILETSGSEVPNGVMKQLNEMWRKVELMFEQLSLFSSQSVNTRSASARIIEVGKERFESLMAEFQGNYKELNAKMIKEAKLRDVTIEVSGLKLYKRSIQLCDDVIKGNVYDDKWAPDIATRKVIPWREAFQAMLSQCSKASQLFGSLSGLCKGEVIDLRISMTELQSYVEDSVTFARGLSLKSIHPLLDIEEAAAVHAFTRSDPFSSSGLQLYTEVNNILQNTTHRINMSQYFAPYIELMQRGMRRFPPYSGVAFRGEHGDYCKGTQKVLYRLTSFTTSLTVALRPEFTEDGGTVFVVPNFTGYDIRQCSAHKEMEVQTELLTVFHVADKFRVSAWDRKADYAQHVDSYQSSLSRFSNSLVVVLFKE